MKKNTMTSNKTPAAATTPMMMGVELELECEGGGDPSLSGDGWDLPDMAGGDQLLDDFGDQLFPLDDLGGD